MVFEKHSFKVDGYSAIAPEDVAMFFQNYAIENNETYKEYRITEATKSYKKTVTKAKKSKWEWRI
jgi:hypothetical protein